VVVHVVMGVYSYDSVLSRFEHDKPHRLTESNRLHHSNLAQITASILTRAKSHLDGWETTSHKDTCQTQHHKDGKTCMTLLTKWLSITTQYNPDPKV
jgi:hypothetical protein